jgi:hypothetical protein
MCLNGFSLKGTFFISDRYSAGLLSESFLEKSNYNWKPTAFHCLSFRPFFLSLGFPNTLFIFFIFSGHYLNFPSYFRDYYYNYYYLLAVIFVIGSLTIQYISLAIGSILQWILWLLLSTAHTSGKENYSTV